MSNSFPNIRLRRNRRTSWLREILAETSLNASDFIMPFFVISGQNKKESIKTLLGQFRFSIDLLIEQIKKAQDLGIKAIMLFPVINQNLKMPDGLEALNENNLICKAVREIKKQVPNIGIICDVALDPYTTHGHDGLLDQDGIVNNDLTLDILCKQALIQSQAGCDIISPSDMMDGRVGAIRKTLDKNGFSDVAIMSYAAKYASSFYGPFRGAIGSDKNLMVGDKKNYQMDFRNSIEAKREIKLDMMEGADMIIIKPGMPYLDIVSGARNYCDLPIISYQVSGEYAMLKLAGEQGIINFEEALFESLIAFKRAGASAIISYGSMEILQLFRNDLI